MSKVILLRGLPASGKTTWAKQYQKEHADAKRVNRDELRAMLDNSVWSKENENFVVSMEEAIIESALLKGYEVIIDDTNLAEKTVERWQTLVERYNQKYGEDINLHCGLIEVKHFDTPVEECIARDAKRVGRARVGEGVIRRFYNDHYANKAQK